MDYTDSFQTTRLSELREPERKNLTTFAKGICSNISSSYIEDRLQLYDKLLAFYRKGRLTSLQLINEFRQGSKKYFYMGPLFSRHASFLPLFFSWLENEWNSSTDSEIYLLTECQNPEIFLVFKALFHQHSYPSITCSHIPTPDKITNAIRAFSGRLGHIHELNTNNFSSVSDETFYVPRKSYEPVTKWMESKGVFLQKGHNQLLLVCLNGKTKELVMDKIKIVREQMMNWKNYKKELLQQFEKGTTNG